MRFEDIAYHYTASGALGSDLEKLCSLGNLSEHPVEYPLLSRLSGPVTLTGKHELEGDIAAHTAVRLIKENNSSMLRKMCWYMEARTAVSLTCSLSAIVEDAAIDVCLRYGTDIIDPAKMAVICRRCAPLLKANLDDIKLSCRLSPHPPSTRPLAASRGTSAGAQRSCSSPPPGRSTAALDARSAPPRSAAGSGTPASQYCARPL